jgi:alpha-tubulin suppressor-like RCC1 family protein
MHPDGGQQQDAQATDTSGGDSAVDNGSGSDAGPALVDVSTGGNSACALRPDGTVVCWGLNQFGALGDGTLGGDTCPSAGVNYLCRGTPTPVVGLTGIVSINVGQFHACAVKSDGTLWCWGQNGSSQLGHSSGDSTCTDPGNATTVACSPTPTQVTSFPAGTQIKQVSGGLYHTCALTAGGDVYCFGSNALGALGAPLTTTSSATPLRVTGFSSAALEVQVAPDHSRMSCARLTDSTVSCWGQNNGGSLGHDPTNDPNSGTTPYHAPAPVVDAQQNPLSGVASLGIGGLGGCVLKTDGTIWCWGENNYGVLANGAAGDGNLHALAQVVLALPAHLVALARRDFEALALDPDGNVWAWGRNNYAELGDGTLTGDTACGSTCKSTPVKLSGVSNVAKIAISGGNGFAVKTDGTVWGWGGADTGVAGHAPNTNGDSACGASTTAGTLCNPTPVHVVGLP